MSLNLFLNMKEKSKCASQLEIQWYSTVLLPFDANGIPCEKAALPLPTGGALVHIAVSDSDLSWGPPG